MECPGALVAVEGRGALLAKEGADALLAEEGPDALRVKKCSFNFKCYNFREQISIYIINIYKMLLA